MKAQGARVTDVAVRLDGVSRAYGATRVLRGLSMVLHAGERLAVVGPNGSGKTTLVRLVAGLARAASGTVEVLGAAPSHADVRRRIGVVGHEPMLYAHLTALENLRLWACLYDVRESGEELLDGLGLDPRDRRTVAEYSRGMRQRVALARALVHRPELLLLDEPFTGLDEDGAGRARTLVAQSGATVLLATHAVEGALGLHTRSAALRDGTLAELG